jgi:SAM-dependent methyltransferase
MTEAAIDNAEQIEYWNGEAGQGWAERNQQMEKTLGPLAEEVIAAANPMPAETVLDIGCGCADTSLSLLHRVGPTGRVLGVDISRPMLDIAATKVELLPADLRGAIAFEQADASTYPFEAGRFDLLFSRFGVMFFADPAAAFANMRTALKPGGRIAFLCWAPVPENEWITVPMGAALQHVPPPEPTPPNAPGPFGLSNPEFVEQVLNEAGYSNINIGSTRPTMRFGHGMQKEQVVDFFVDVSPASRVLNGAPPELVEPVRSAIAQAIMPYHDGETINLSASCWLVTARNENQ